MDVLCLFESQEGNYANRAFIKSLITSDPRYFGGIHLVEFKDQNNGVIYYVCDDGHHRVSIAKKYGAKRLKVLIDRPDFS